MVHLYRTAIKQWQEKYSGEETLIENCYDFFSTFKNCNRNLLNGFFSHFHCIILHSKFFWFLKGNNELSTETEKII